MKRQNGTSLFLLSLTALTIMALAGCGAGGGSRTSAPTEAADGKDAGSAASEPAAGLSQSDAFSNAESDASSNAESGVSSDNASASGKDASMASGKDTSVTSGKDASTVSGKDTSTAPDKDAVVWQLRIVDGALSGHLMLAGQGSGQVYSLSVNDIPVYLDGEPAAADALQDGMMIDVTFDGTVMETYPGQLGQVYDIHAYSQGTQQNPYGSCFDLCGLYLQVLNDLWERDPGLNDDILHISLDLSQAPGDLTDGEKSAIAWIFAGQHGADALTLSYEELAQQGYLTEVADELYQWEDGILFTISCAQWEEGEIYSLRALKFNARKWRSPLGAYYFQDCLVIWPQSGTWGDYQIGSELIS